MLYKLNNERNEMVQKVRLDFGVFHLQQLYKVLLYYLNIYLLLQYQNLLSQYLHWKQLNTQTCNSLLQILSLYCYQSHTLCLE